MGDTFARIIANIVSGPSDPVDYTKQTEIDPTEVIGFRAKQYITNFVLILFFIVVFYLLFSGTSVNNYIVKAGKNAASVNPIDGG